MDESNKTHEIWKERINSDFEYLHRNPEVSWKEVNTTSYIQKRLNDIGMKTTTFHDVTGVVGEWDGKEGLTVALRADMDALWQEVDGKWQANHSCGHDAHMTMVLGALELLRESDIEQLGKIKVIFQPAEEKGAGALAMVEKGVVDDVDFLYGVHLRPIQELTLGQATPAIYNGAMLLIEGDIYGLTSHGARPHLGINAIEVAFQLQQALKTIHPNPMVPASIKMTKLHAGGENINTIPDHAYFALDIRAQTNEVLNELEEKVKQIVAGISQLSGAKIEVKTAGKSVAAEVSEDAMNMMKASIIDVMGEDYVANGIITPGGEDFHFYTVKRPSIKATMLGLGCDLTPGLHHPKMTFNQDALFAGAQILARAVENTLLRG